MLCCISRLDYGKKYCHHSPTMHEEPLQQAILNAINRLMTNREELLERITNAGQIELTPMNQDGMNLPDIDKRLKMMEEEIARLIKESAGDIAGYQEQFRTVMNEAAELKEQKKKLLEQQENQKDSFNKVRNMVSDLQSAPSQLTEWDECVIRQLVETVTVLDKNIIRVTLLGGEEIEQTVEF